VPYLGGPKIFGVPRHGTPCTIPSLRVGWSLWVECTLVCKGFIYFTVHEFLEH
jgi:hypothetical protein